MAWEFAVSVLYTKIRIKILKSENANLLVFFLYEPIKYGNFGPVTNCTHAAREILLF